MEEIILIKADSSDIYEFSSKQISLLDDKWEGKWTISSALGGTPILEGTLAKNTTILNDDSLENEDYKKSYEIFEGDKNDLVNITDETIDSGVLTLKGTITNSDVVVPDKYLYITITGVFVPYTRTVRVKTNTNGEFVANIDLKPTIKTPENSFFIFQISPTQSELLEVGTYFLSVQITHKNGADELIFRKEVLQAKLKIKQQGVLL